ncbi:hypothetical protein DL766_003663 [Monosporascus sp. MC13-8B]|nr:hypothetical protein DL763_004311 [Monosporascus cannonballus]RYP33070.1 hypothetical protein DL766_003663 [Monosporascus sp. MC13-8B]
MSASHNIVSRIKQVSALSQPLCFICRSTSSTTKITVNIKRMMTTTITVKSDIPVDLPEGLTEETLLAFAPFNASSPMHPTHSLTTPSIRISIGKTNGAAQTWLATLTRSLSLQRSVAAHTFHKDPYALRRIAVQSYDLFGSDSKRLGFLKLRAEVANAAGETLPGSVFLRGPSVAMLVVLIPDDTGTGPGSGKKMGGEEGEEERYVLLTVQPRIPAGSLAFVELPAGMVDDQDTFAGAAAREIEEELGLTIPAAQLRCLSDMAFTTREESHGQGQDQNQDRGQGRVQEGDCRGEEEEEDLARAMYPSAGGCDEFIPIYMHERRVPRAQLREWTGKLTGLRDSGEKITLKLVRMRDLWREGGRDAKCLAAVALWEGLRREGKL